MLPLLPQAKIKAAGERFEIHIDLIARVGRALLPQHRAPALEDPPDCLLQHPPFVGVRHPVVHARQPALADDGSLIAPLLRHDAVDRVGAAVGPLEVDHDLAAVDQEGQALLPSKVRRDGEHALPRHGGGSRGAGHAEVGLVLEPVADVQVRPPLPGAGRQRPPPTRLTAWRPGRRTVPHSSRRPPRRQQSSCRVCSSRRRSCSSARGACRSAST
mmetsp:Transcript_5823/g.13294  ORF Transcript_5823/g.13294 Transcript_5823/m.13294 type:complete len:215 (+) Transcript_5823:5014-5658(+)